jgi:hypothetical protein
MEGVVITVERRQFPEAMDWEDGNWLISPIRISVGRFVGELPAMIRVNELEAFRLGLERINETLSGEAEFAAMEGWLSLVIKCSRSGSLSVSGSATDEPGVGNTLQFEIDGMDQSFLPELIDQLRAVEQAFALRKS